MSKERFIFLCTYLFMYFLSINQAASSQNLKIYRESLLITILLQKNMLKKFLIRSWYKPTQHKIHKFKYINFLRLSMKFFNLMYFRQRVAKPLLPIFFLWENTWIEYTPGNWLRVQMLALTIWFQLNDRFGNLSKVLMFPQKTTLTIRFQVNERSGNPSKALTFPL